MLTNNDGMSAQAIAAGKGFTSLTSLLAGVTSPSSPTSAATLPGDTEVCQPPQEEQEEQEDEEGEVSQDISEVLEFLKPREVNQLIALKKEVDESKKQMTENESAFKSRIKSKETNLNDIHVQLEQAQKLEESLKKDLRKVSKDIDVLQRQDLDIRNEISTENKHFHYSKSVRERNVKESSERLNLFISEMKEKEKERKETSEGQEGARPLSRPPSVYEGLHLQSELECPICFELSRPPVYQCPEGHIICGNCRPRVTRCPVCRFVFKVSHRQPRTKCIGSERYLATWSENNGGLSLRWYNDYGLWRLEVQFH